MDEQFNYKTGDLVNNSTLFIRDSYRNKYLCSCSKCGMTTTYSKEELSEYYPHCKCCDEIKNSTQVLNRNNNRLIVGDRDTARRLIKNYNENKYRNNTSALTKSIGNDILQNFVGKPFGNLILEGFIGTAEKGFDDYYRINDVNRALFVCNTCGYAKIEQLKRLESGFRIDCPNCSKVLQQVQDNSSIEIEQFNSLKRQHEKTINNRNKEQKTVKMVAMPRVKTPMDNAKDGGKVEKYIENIHELNPTLKVQGIIPSGATFTAHCACSKCGGEVVIPSTLKKKQVDCVGCKQLKNNPNYVGYYNKDWTGTTRNGLTITEQDGLSCNVKCRMCGRIQENIKLYDVLYNIIYCDCPESDLDGLWYCDNCGKPLNIKMKNILGKSDNSQDIKCNNCGENSGIIIQEAINEVVASDIKATTCNRLNIAIKDYRNSTVDVNGIIKEKEPTYIGTDDLPYYKCRCIEHNTDMTLNDEEIANFDHTKYCEDIRHHLLDNIDISKIQL